MSGNKRFEEEFSRGGMETLSEKRGPSMVELHAQRMKAIEEAKKRMAEEEEQERERKRKKQDDRSDESESGESESSDSDDEGQKSKKHKRESKKKNHKKEKHKKHKKESNRREKRKKEKRIRKEEERERTKKMHGFDDQFGRFGICKAEDMWSKRPEFAAWLLEVKKVDIEHLASWEEKEHFKTYMEDFNTATLPHRKYYNLDKYHAEKQAKAEKKGVKYKAREMTTFNDEEARRREIEAERMRAREQAVANLKGAMQSKEGQRLVQDIKRQEELKLKQDMLFKTGNVEEAKKLAELLKPDEEKFDAETGKMRRKL